MRRVAQPAAQIKTSGRWKILAAAALFSTGGALIKSCSLSAWQVAGFRSGFAVPALWALAPESRRGWTWRTWLVGAAYASVLILFVAANKSTTAANAIFLQSTAPFYLLLLAPRLLGEPLPRRDAPYMAALALGMALLFFGSPAARVSAPRPGLGNLLAAASGLSWALTLIGLRFLGRGSSGAAGATVAGNLLAFLACLPWALPLGGAGLRDWVLVAVLGVFQIGLAYKLLTSGMGSVGALEASLLLLLEPVLNPLWAWLVHGETLGAFSAAGAGVILTASVIHAGLPDDRTSGGADR